MMKFNVFYKKLINEGVSQAKKLYVDTHKIDPHTFEELVKFDPTPQKKYIEWMAKSYLTIPDMRKYSVIADFDKLANKNVLPNKDIYTYKNIEAVDDIVRRFENVQTKSEIKKGVKDFESDIKPEDKVFENNNVVVVHAKNKEDSCKYGRGATWCTAAMGDRNYFRNYHFSNGVNLYYILPKIDVSNLSKNHDITKIAVAVYPTGKKEVYDYKDERMDAEFPTIAKKLGIPL